jgi:hypothetical protein
MDHHIVNVLMEARASILDPKDWWGGGNQNPAFGHCALQAIASVSSDTGQMVDGLAALAGALGFDVAVHLRENLIPEWNDSSSHAIVIAGFDRAIAAEHAKLRVTNIDCFVRLLESTTDQAVETVE